MNVNWKEAILQAQKKIDQVLDIRPETVEVEVEETAEKYEDVEEPNSPSSSPGSEPLAEDIVVLEPVLPPFLSNRYIGDDIQTIVSSDIEHLTRASSRTASPDRQKIQMEFDTDVSICQISPIPPPQAVVPLNPNPNPIPVQEIPLANSEDIFNQAMQGLRKELNEYKKANQILQQSHANLEREMEESRFSGNEKVVNLLSEERDHFNQEISQLKKTCTQAMTEKLELEEKYRKTNKVLIEAKDMLQYFKNQTDIVKNTLRKSQDTLCSDFENFGAELNRTLMLRYKVKEKESIRKVESNFDETTNEQQIAKLEVSTQTDNCKEEIPQSLLKEEKENIPSSPVKHANVTDLLQIIEHLEMEKKTLLVERNNDKREIKKLREQLNETLIMHGEKIEQLDEAMVDNEELKNILKQQALALTNNGT